MGKRAQHTPASNGTPLASNGPALLPAAQLPSTPSASTKAALPAAESSVQKRKKSTTKKQDQAQAAVEGPLPFPMAVAGLDTPLAKATEQQESSDLEEQQQPIPFGSLDFEASQATVSEKPITTGGGMITTVRPLFTNDFK